MEMRLAQKAMRFADDVGVSGHVGGGVGGGEVGELISNLSILDMGSPRGRVPVPL